ISWSRAFVGLRYAQASSSPRPRDGFPNPNHLSPFELAAVPFCSRPNSHFQFRQRFISVHPMFIRAHP
ncbi:MAG TPA: hypothetical protein VFE51_19850, partial [Verrucomicrobiae bacterium]|nr:hypothetical protein [Verrucomicrobiae bacterium]